jgi:hypothetical protein
VQQRRDSLKSRWVLEMVLFSLGQNAVRPKKQFLYQAFTTHF